jgi:hypothetical protein
MFFEFVPLIVREYGQAAIHGTKRVLHALPRLLTVLIEFGHDAQHVADAKQASSGGQTMLASLKASLEKHSDAVRASKPWDKRAL